MGKITIKTGSSVEGDDFYGRKKELQYAWETHILKGTSLLLSAPRRVGKSSFSKKLLAMAEENGWKTMYFDLEGINTESAFVKLFKEELQKEKDGKNVKSKAIDKVLNIVESVKGSKIGGLEVSINSDVWNTYESIKQLIEDADKILIVIDELTIYLDSLLRQENGKEKVEYFLAWLRNIRQTTKARWIFCSSVGIENFASMHQLSKHLNDLYSFPIGPFTDDEAKDFITHLEINEKIQFTKEHVQYILKKLGWPLPFFIQILIEKIDFLFCVDGKQLSNKTIDEACDRLIKENQIHLNSWIERLKEYNELKDDARKILEACAESNGCSRRVLQAKLSAKRNNINIEKVEDNLSQLLYMLQNDGYLTEHKGKYIFRSPLLRDFWYNHFVR